MKLMTAEGCFCISSAMQEPIVDELLETVRRVGLDTPDRYGLDRMRWSYRNAPLELKLILSPDHGRYPAKLLYGGVTWFIEKEFWMRVQRVVTTEETKILTYMRQKPLTEEELNVSSETVLRVA